MPLPRTGAAGRPAGSGTLTVEDSKVLGNASKGIEDGWEPGDVRRAMLARNFIEQDHDEGIFLYGFSTAAILVGNVVTAKGTGFLASLATTLTRGDNTIGNNGADIAGLLTPLGGK